MTEIVTADGTRLSAYRAEPVEAPKGAVVVLADLYGLTPQLLKAADAFAAAGYLTLAPGLPDPADGGLAYTPEGRAAGAAAVAALEPAVVLGAVEAAVAAVKDAGKVALVGYGWGGLVAFLAAQRIAGLAAAVGYYPEGVLNAPREKRRVPTLLHFGEDDPLLPIDDVRRFRFDRPDVSAFAYAGAGHGFDVSDTDGFAASVAELAREKTLAFISQFVVGQAPVAMKNAGAYAQAKSEKKGKKAAAGADLGPPME